MSKAKKKKIRSNPLRSVSSVFPSRPFERSEKEKNPLNGDKFSGYLTNMPLYIEDLEIGDVIEFETKNIIDSDVKSEEVDLVEKYFHICFVTNEVSKKKRKVKYLYIEEILGEQREGIYNSGWRIMAGDESQDYMDDKNNFQILSLGYVLNIDDTIIDVLDESVGSEFKWDDSRNEFRK